MDSDQIAVLFAGKLVGRKAPHLILDAVKLLNESSRARTVVVFLGDGELKEALRTLAGAEPKVAIRFAGFQNQQAISQYYCAGDMLVLPSIRNETWGVVVNEALYHGLPCVVSDLVGCAPDLIEVGRTGEIFPSGNVDGLAKALERAMGLVRCADTAARCEQKARTYSVESAAKGIAEAYEAVTTGDLRTPLRHASYPG